jgi:hypothetical protein
MKIEIAVRQLPTCVEGHLNFGFLMDEFPIDYNASY